MPRRRFRWTWAWLLAPVVCWVAGEPARGEQEQAVNSGLQYLRSVVGRAQVGETAMIALALLKCDTPQTDPVLRGCLATIQQRFTSSGYSPQRTGGHDVYEAAVVAMALSNLEGGEHRSELDLVATYLLGKQKANGSWDYDTRPYGDTSISQYALLGLWECDNAGIDIPPSVWDRAAGWYLSKQGSGGSWNYHRDQPEYRENMSMTAAGVGSLLLCKRQLERYRQSRRGSNALLTVIATDNSNQNYAVSTSLVEIDKAVQKGMAWLASNYTTSDTNRIGQSIYYALYGLERVAAFAERNTIGRVDILEKGRSFIRASQQADGSWRALPQTDDMNTVWSILYLVKSTAKSIKRAKIKRLGAGTLVGGRYLPSDLTSMTVAGGRVMSRPMNGAVEGMLAVLEDPRAQTADAAVAGLIVKFQREGPDALRPFKDRFRKLLSDRDAGMRQVAAWALARTGDLDVVPDLIAALLDPEENVVDAARTGLQLLSRKIDGLGPPSPSTPEQRQAAAKAWREWYDAIRPLDVDADDDLAIRPPPAPGAAKPVRSPKP
ncbi:MAG: HEAT repeat domain-containing protein [Isosphaeraceae bacterium]